MAKKAGKAAGRQKPAQKKRSTNGVPPEKLHGHRDPIVADNADVRIDFTKPPQDLDDGRLWGRAYSKFKKLEAKFDGARQPSLALKAFSTLTFSYSRPGNAEIDETLEFKSTDLGVVLVTVKRDKLKHRADNRRFLVPASLSGLRLRTVAGEPKVGKPFTIPLFNGDQPMFTDVSITIVAD